MELNHHVSSPPIVLVRAHTGLRVEALHIPSLVPQTDGCSEVLHAITERQELSRAEVHRLACRRLATGVRDFVRLAHETVWPSRSEGRLLLSA